MYEEARQAALRQQRGADLLINAKITTILTSCLAFYYKTDIAIDGTAVKLAAPLPPSR